MAVSAHGRAGRFYQAFYQWTISTAVRHPCRQHPVALHFHPGACRFSTACSRGLDAGIESSIRRKSTRDGQTAIGANGKSHKRSYASETPIRQDGQASGLAKEPRNARTTTAAGDLSHACRSVLRTLTHPVIVLTARDKTHPSDGLSQLRGVTVSSFTSITLEPIPYVCFNLKLPSRTWDAILTCPVVTAHILPGDVQGARVAHTFTQPHDNPAQPFHNLKRIGVDIDHQDTKNPPQLCKEDRIIARLTAEVDLEKCTCVGDHVLVVAKVLDVHRGVYNESQHGSALSYGAKSYRALGQALEVEQQSFAEGHGTRNAAPKLHTGQRREFSTGHAFFTSGIRQKSDIHQPRREDLVTDLSILQRTVSEFLGEPTPKEGMAPIRKPMRPLLNLNEKIAQATKELDTLMASHPEDTVRAAELQSHLDSLDRGLTRILAKRSARDLDDAMNRGSVDYRLVQWQEKVIEKGQTVLLREAQDLREKFESQELSKEEFRELALAIKVEYDALNETTTRLKALTMEEQDDGTSSDNF